MQPHDISRVKWIYGFNSDRAYLGYGNFRELYHHLAFLKGVKGLIEYLFILFEIHSRNLSENDTKVNNIWKYLSHTFGNIESALLLYTDYYKETSFVGPICIVGGQKYFVKIFKTEDDAKAEKKRADMLRDIASKLFCIPDVLVHADNIVAYQVLEKKYRSVKSSVLKNLALDLGKSALLLNREETVFLDLINIQYILSLSKVFGFSKLVRDAIDVVTNNDEALKTSTWGHGDFTPWNAFYNRDNAVCLVDYERVCVGPPFMDIFHLITQKNALSGNARLPTDTILLVSREAGVDLAKSFLWYIVYLLMQLETDLDLHITQKKTHKQIRILIETKADILRKAVASFSSM